MIRLLQNHDYMAFIETYTQPNVLVQLSAQAEADMIATLQNPFMIASLQSIQRVPPVYDVTGETATYVAKFSVNGETVTNNMTLIKVNGRWYLK